MYNNEIHSNSANNSISIMAIQLKPFSDSTPQILTVLLLAVIVISILQDKAMVALAQII